MRRSAAQGSTRVARVRTVTQTTHKLCIGYLTATTQAQLYDLLCFRTSASQMGGGGGSGGDASRATYMAVLRMPVAACSVEEWLFSAAPAAPAACQNMSGGPRGGQVDETEVLTVWVQMVNAVHRCHAHGVVHHGERSTGGRV